MAMSTRWLLIAVCATGLVGGAAARAATSTEHKITMQFSAYAPTALNARVGDTLVFVNDDDTNHTVFVPTVGFGIDLGPQKPSETRRLTLRRDGRFEVECVNHAAMLLTITVTR